MTKFCTAFDIESDLESIENVTEVRFSETHCNQNPVAFVTFYVAADLT